MRGYNSLNDYEHVGLKLWKRMIDGKLFRLFGREITPNGCWLLGAQLRELKDIDVSTGKDVYGPEVIEFETSVVQGCYEYERY